MKLKKLKLKKDVFWFGWEIRGGGCWHIFAAQTETASRNGVTPSCASYYLGIRLFRSLK